MVAFGYDDKRGNMDYNLIVKHPFGDYARGDAITDADKIAAALAVGADNVVRIQAPTPVAQGAAQPSSAETPTS